QDSVKTRGNQFAARRKRNRVLRQFRQAVSRFEKAPMNNALAKPCLSEGNGHRSEENEPLFGYNRHALCVPTAKYPPIGWGTQPKRLVCLQTHTLPMNRMWL